MECQICKDGKDCNFKGIALTGEVIKYFKVDLLKLQYSTHPFPLRFGNLLGSCAAFGQVLVHARAGIIATYYTDNKTFLKFPSQLEEKFGVKIRSAAEAPSDVLMACEYAAEKP